MLFKHHHRISMAILPFSTPTLPTGVQIPAAMLLPVGTVKTERGCVRMMWLLASLLHGPLRLLSTSQLAPNTGAQTLA